MSIEQLHLQSRQKWTVNGTSRIMPAQETLERVTSVSQKIGVTRLADITNMDILGIPNYSAVLPGTEDYIWVYSGKGPTKVHAKASALMECIERYSSLPSGGPKNFIRGSYDQLSKSFHVLHPDEIVEPVRFQYKNDMLMDFLPGFDLFTNEQIMVPASLALFRYSPVPPSLNPFAFHHTNGLASGNVMEEAICHALCEVIERDAMSLAELRASAIPFHFLRHMINVLKSNGYPLNSNFIDKYVDDPSVFPDVNISQIEFQPVEFLVKKFAEANIPLMRAITEVSQTRAANIQGARDDLRKIKYRENDTDDKRAWQFMQSSRTIKFSDITTYSNYDILDDIKLILEHLKQAGLRRAIIVNLTNDSIEIPVVRAIVPGLETFKITKSVMGWRARRYFKN